MMNTWLAKLSEIPPTDEEQLEQSLADLPNGELLEIAFEEGIEERPTETETLQEKIAAVTRTGRSLAHEYGRGLQKTAIIASGSNSMATVSQMGGKAGQAIASSVKPPKMTPLPGASPPKNTTGNVTNFTHTVSQNLDHGKGSRSTINSLGLAKGAMLKHAIPLLGAATNVVGKVMGNPAVRAGMGAMNAKGRAAGVKGVYDSFSKVAQSVGPSIGQTVGRAVHQNPWMLPAGAAAAGVALSGRDQQGNKDYLPGLATGGLVGLGAYHAAGGAEGIRNHIAGTGGQKPLLGQGVADAANMSPEQFQQMRGAAAAQAQAQGAPAASAPAASAPAASAPATPGVVPNAANAEASLAHRVGAGIRSGTQAVVGAPGKAGKGLVERAREFGRGIMGNPSGSGPAIGSAEDAAAIEAKASRGMSANAAPVTPIERPPPAQVAQSARGAMPQAHVPPMDRPLFASGMAPADPHSLQSILPHPTGGSPLAAGAKALTQKVKPGLLGQIAGHVKAASSPLQKALLLHKHAAGPFIGPAPTRLAVGAGRASQAVGKLTAATAKVNPVAEAAAMPQNWRQPERQTVTGGHQFVPPANPQRSGSYADTRNMNPVAPGVKVARMLKWAAGNPLASKLTGSSPLAVAGRTVAKAPSMENFRSLGKSSVSKAQSANPNFPSLSNYRSVAG